MNAVSDMPRDWATVQTSAGELMLFAQRFEDIGAFSKLAPDESPSRRLRSYLPRIASRSTEPREGGERLALDEATCLQLSDEDIERIAETYLTLPAVRKIAEDQKARSDPMDRAVAELSTTYLDRLLRVEHDRQMEDPAKTYAAFSERFGGALTTALLDVDRQATSLKDAAATFITDHDAAAQARWAEHQASIHLASFADPVAAFGEPGNASPGGIEGRGGPTLDASARSDRDAVVELTRSIGWITAQSAHLLSGLSDSATHFLRQFADAAETSEARTRRLLRVAIAMIVIASVLSAAACALIVLAVRDRWEHERIAAQWQESLVQSLKSNAAAQDQRLAAIETAVRELKGRQQAEPNAPPQVTDAIARGDSKETSSSAKHDSAKTTPSTRQAKRKTTR